ncbi:glutamine-rich protein 2-like isoform X4 [Acropora muricata]|uniref:glutamine-rich protein 2-like isoform X4 n=1 Tax=Acropora muricata TaxID=159855 RepID=UPI0034E57BC4
MTTVHVELDQLLNLALGTPEQGAVNFNILHGVLREILSHLGIEKKGKDIAEDGEFRAAFALLKNKQETTQETSNINDGLQSSKTFGEEGTTNKIPLSTATIFPPFGGNLESKVASIEKKLEILDDLPSNGEILQRAKLKKDEKITPVADMWQFININRRLGATEIGIEKLTSLLDAMMSEVGDIKDAAKEINTLKNQMSELEKLNTRLNERITALESVDSSEEKKKLEDLLMELQNLKKQVDELPTKDDLDCLDIYVKWPQLEEALNAKRSRNPSAKSRASTPKAKSPTPPPLRTPTPPPPRPSTPHHPSPEALEALRQIGELMDKHEILVEQVDALEGLMPKKANMEDLEDLRNRPDVPDDILEQLKCLREGLDAINRWKNEDGDALNALRSLVTELQGEQEKINNTTKELIEEHNRKQKHIDALYTYSDKLQEMKADKEQVAMEMDVKADKHTVDKLVSRSKFDQSIGGLDQSLQELLQRVEGQESALKDALDRIAADIDQKLDRLELNPVKDHFEKKIKNMKCKHVDSLPVNDDPAAGFRKAMLRFHCISCDRPVDMVPGNPNPALPQTPGLPPSRSGRPYTTYELDQMRQIHRGAYTYEQEAATTTARSCGGSHTVTYPHRRSARMSQYYYYREDDTPVPLPQRDETDLIGQDGHIYKGRFDGFDRMPDLPQNPRSPRAMSAKRAASAQPPRSVSPNNRPRSAAVPSALRNQEEEIEPAGVVVQ